MIVDYALYEQGRRSRVQPALGDVFEACRIEGSFAWVELRDPTPEELDRVRAEFHLHELAIEDAAHAQQRPKLELYGDSLFVVLRTVYLDDDETLEPGELHVFLGDGFVVTVEHGRTPVLADVRRGLEARPELLRCGPAAALYGLVDAVVDEYEPAIDRLDVAIDDVEAQVFSSERDNSAQRIYRLKRDVLDLHRAIAPLVDPLAKLASVEHPLVHESLRTYFRDVHDHLVRMAHAVDGYRELLTSVLTSNLTQAGFRQNEDVRKISAWAAIITVPTAIAGIYGMNFEHMPELGWRIGYPLALLLMAAICFALYRRFKRAGWL
ncbi:MAG: magnesium/cobalt transporter CorA [Actinobacteria bacterium]|nr:magnesium/cobalt transporter CorA [Actinomycetota bacterium]